MVQCTYSNRLEKPERLRPNLPQERTGSQPDMAMFQFDTLQKQSKEGVEAVMKSFGALARGAQAAAVEMTDFTKKSFEQGSAAAEKLAGAKSFDRVVEVQGDFVRASYEGLVAQSSKLGEIATASIKESMAVMEGLVAKKAV